MPRSVSKARAAALAVTAVLAFGPSSVHQVTSQIDPGNHDQAAAAEAAPIAAHVNPRTAASDKVVITLQRLDQEVSGRTDGVTAAEKEHAAAAADQDAAAAARAETEQRVASLAERSDAVDATGGTVEPPTTDVFQMLNAGPSASTASLPSETAVGEPTALDKARSKLDAAEQVEDDANEAAEQTAAAAENAAAALADAKAEESAFVASVQDRVANNLVAAEAIAPAQPRRAQAARSGAAAIAGSIERIAAAKEQREAAAAAAVSASREAARERAAAPAAPAPPAPPPAPPPPPPLPDPTGSASGALAGVWCPDRTQIVVDGSIGGNVQALVNDAFAAGIGLCGNGFRSYAEQVELRRANCGPSDYATFQAPPSTCSPPTARPGRSNHEDGLAIDFRCADGQPMTHASPCYQWLAAHAAGYGLHNLPSEPWHWSVSGR
jgi:D-alanyl-D-alanine carboxypeptidase